MIYWKNGKSYEIPDPTAEEVAEIRKQEALARIQEKSRPLSEGEVISMLLTQKVQEIEVDNNTALRMMSYYPTFEDSVGRTVKKGFKFTHANKLWSVVQPEMTIQGHYPPGIGMESLYAEICETHDGTMEDPIPYSGNMALEKGKYYIQDGEIYRCTRDTVNPVYHALRDLVGLYVEIA
jgi:exoribonuclease II